jgi:hypothetical protein
MSRKLTGHHVPQKISILSNLVETYMAFGKRRRSEERRAVVPEIIRLYGELKGKDAGVRNYLGEEAYWIAVRLSHRARLKADTHVEAPSDDPAVRQLRGLLGTYITTKWGMEKKCLSERIFKLYNTIKEQSDLREALTRYEFTVIRKITRARKRRRPPAVAEHIEKHPAVSSEKPSVLSSVINLSYRQEKFRVRRWLLEEAAAMFPDAIKALTLPGSEWLLERDILLSRPGSDIIGIESEKAVFDYSRANIPPSPKILYLNMSDAEHFSRKSSAPRNFVWLDYMGQFMPGRLDVFRKMLSNGHIGDLALVALTFLKGRDGQAVPLYRQFGEPEDVRGGKFNRLREKAIPELYRVAAAESGYDLSVIRVEEYKEQQGSQKCSPMLLVAFRLSKIPGASREDSKAAVYAAIRGGEPVDTAMGYTKMQIAGFPAAITRQRRTQCTAVSL